MSTVPEAATEQLRSQLDALSWPDRFERLALEEAGSFSAGRRADVSALTMEYAGRAIAELREGWGSVPFKEAILRLPSKRMRGALGQAAKRLRDRSIVELTRRGSLPSDEPFGQGMDERVVEMPLALRALRLHEPGEVLDAGFAMNVPVVRELAGRPAARMTHFTLEGSIEPLLPGDEDRFVRAFGDLRSMPFSDGSFDRVVCVSTLEHVGMDTARFGVSSAQAPGTARDAVAELIRVLARGGELFITVPYGRRANHGWFRVFDADDLRELLAPIEAHDREERFFYYEHGWAEGGPTPPSHVLNAGFSPDVVTAVAIARITKAGAPR